MLDSIEADRAEPNGLLHGRVQVRKVEAFHEAQDLHIFPPAMLGHSAFHQAAQRREFLGQVPALERSGLIQRVDLLLDQRQVMNGIEDDVLTLPAPRMTRDDLAAAADYHRVDIAPDPNILMAIGDRYGIVVGLVAHQRLGCHPGAGLVAGIEGTHGRQITL